ncbi:MAG TPA: hypothetical protein PKU91_02570, partial [Phycisphaerales bacterium]|nr:hypothetical protein [Phycisphaerales bacterium]
MPRVTGDLFLPDDRDIADHAAIDPEGTTTLMLEGPRGRVFREGSARETRRKGFGLGPSRHAGPEASLVFRFASGVLVAPESKVESPGLMIQRTWFAYYDPIDGDADTDEPGEEDTADAVRAWGVVLVMPGLYGTPEPTIDVLVRRLRESGLGVLRMLSQPSRFTERTRLDLDPGAIEQGVDRAVSILGDRVGECALSAQAAWWFLESQRPDLAGVPKVVLGTSGGAMILPTVVAREPDRYAAGVLVAGAADLWLIARRSAYVNDARSIEVRVNGRVIEGEEAGAIDWRRFDRLYLERAALDPFHTARALHGKPTLMLHGSADAAVPAPLGDVLWERLGRPERWVYATGHEGLIIEMLSHETQKIIEWIRSAVGRS